MSAGGGGRTLGLTRRGIAVLAAAGMLPVAAYVLGIEGLLFVAAFLAATTGCALLSAHHRRPALSVRRTVSTARITARRPVGVTLEISNLSERTVAPATWVDSWSWNPPSVWGPGRVRGGSDGAPLPTLRPRSTRALAVTRVRHELVPPRRGEYLLGPLVVRVEDPFALAWATVTVGDVASVTADPEVVPLADLGVSFAETDGAARQVHSRALGGEHELTTRDYRAGDPMRRVHWRATAHHGELMVRQEEQRSSAQAGIVLDTRAEDYPDASTARGRDDESPLFEWAVSFTASVAVHLRQAGLVVHVIETADAQLEPGSQGAPLLDGLARIRLVPGSPAGVRPSTPGVRDGASGGTLFAVATDADAAALRAIAALRPASSPAVAFVLAAQGEQSTAASTAATLLRRAGWLCVVVDAATPLDAAWLRVNSEALRHGDA